jgi:DNA-binding MarR family transcriptional regulator
MAKTDDSETDVPPATTLARLERLGRLMRSANRGQGLNPAQWEALRFIAKSNRFSNSPGALTQYLGATKGTISQTVMALERKGQIAKAAREGERRSVTLNLTAKGLDTLSHDPLRNLQAAIGSLGGKTQRRLDKGLAKLLADEVLRQDTPSFGTCRQCRFFQPDLHVGDGVGLPHHCTKFQVAIAEAECDLICVAHSDHPET